VRRIVTLLAVALVMAAMAIAMPLALADPNCTGPLTDRPASCHDTGQPAPANFVDNADGGTAVPNH
jgi:hypothetical protein